MSELSTRHREAMDLAERAEIAKLRGEGGVAELFQRAFELERDAAKMLESRLDAEPTRSVLYRSAASLALNCSQLRQAEQLIATALSGEPPDEIAEELRDLLEQVNFRRHLDLRGWNLEGNEVQVSIAGKAVGYGIASSDQVIDRIQNFEKLIYRTAERKLGAKYREKDQPGKNVREDYGVFVSVPRAASFAVSLQVGLTKDQTALDLGVLDELLACLELFEAANDEQLRHRIPDEPYYRNFVGLARQLAPDGEDVRLVGFTANCNGEQKKVALTRTRDTVSLGPQSPSLEETGEQVVRVSGTLKYADDTKRGAGRIRLVSSDGNTYKVVVPEGMMDDIVRPLWSDEVEVLGVKRNKEIHLRDITRL
jgi:hypothetical protein